MSNEKGNENYINIAFVGAGFLAFLIAGTLLEIAAGTFGIVAQWRSLPAVQHGIPIAAGIATFLVMFLNKNIHTWADESISEVRRVVWPSRKDTIAMTIICCVMVVFAGVAFGVFDFFASQAIKIFVN